MIELLNEIPLISQIGLNQINDLLRLALTRCILVRLPPLLLLLILPSDRVGAFMLASVVVFGSIVVNLAYSFFAFASGFLQDA